MLIRHHLCAPDDGAAAGGAAPAAPQPTPPADAGASANAAPSDEGLRNKQEVVEMRKELRSIGKGLSDLIAALGQRTPAQSGEPKPEPAKAKPGEATDVAALQAQVESLARRSALSEALAAHGIKPGSSAADLLAKVSEGRKADEIAGLAEMVAKMAPAPTQATTPTNPPATTAQPTGRTDTGPPGVSPTTSLPENPNKADPAVLRAMSPEKRKAYVEGWVATGGNINWLRGAPGTRKVPG
jgi:hypothetical protein